MKIQIMVKKITENPGFKSPLRKVKKILSFFLYIFNEGDEIESKQASERDRTLYPDDYWSLIRKLC